MSEEYNLWFLFSEEKKHISGNKGNTSTPYGSFFLAQQTGWCCGHGAWRGCGGSTEVVVAFAEQRQDGWPWGASYCSCLRDS
jgi:hypothetical protein